MPQQTNGDETDGRHKTSTVRFEVFNYDTRFRLLETDAFGGEESITVDLAEGLTDEDGGDIASALKTIYHAPAFNHAHSREITPALGNGVIAIITKDDGEEITATNPQFDSDKEISRENRPVRTDDTIPGEDGKALTMQGWPSDGPRFETPNGLTIQVESFAELGI